MGARAIRASAARAGSSPKLVMASAMVTPSGSARSRVAGSKPPAKARLGATPAEQPFENAAEVNLVAGEILWVKAARTAASTSAAKAAAAKALREGGVAVGVDFTPVEAGALVLVRQQIIGARHLGEACCRLGVALVGIGVELLGELAIGGFDVLLARAARHTKGGIGIGSHFP